jgi:hypothetical protein
MPDEVPERIIRNIKEGIKALDLFGLRTFKKAKGKIHGIIQQDGDRIQIEDE